MLDNVRIIPEAHFERVDQFVSQNRFEDSRNPVKIIETVASKWMEHDRQPGNKTQTHRQFTQHMEIVRRKTQEEFKKPIVMAQRYAAQQPKRLSEHKRKHIHLYSNPHGTRESRCRSAGIQLVNGQQRTKSRISARGELENEEDRTRMVAQKQVIKTYRYGRDRNDERHEVEQVEVKQVSRQYGQRHYRELPRMSEKIQQQKLQREQQDRRESNFSRYKKNKGRITSEFNSDTESAFQRLSDKAQNLHSNLNVEYRRQETQNLSSNSIDSHQKYYQPEGQRLVDTKLDQIRKRKKAIEEEIGRRLGPEVEINQPAENSQLEVNRSQPFSRNNKNEQLEQASRQNSRGIQLMSKQHSSSLSKGKQLAQILNIETATLNPQKGKPAGITVTQAGQFDIMSDLKRNPQLVSEHMKRMQNTAANGQITDAMKKSDPMEVLKEQRKEFNNAVKREVEKSKKFEPNRMSYQSDEEFEDSEINLKESEPSVLQPGKTAGTNIKVINQRERQSLESDNGRPSIIEQLNHQNSVIKTQPNPTLQPVKLNLGPQPNQGVKTDQMDQAAMQLFDLANKQSNLNVQSNLHVQPALNVQSTLRTQGPNMGQLTIQQPANSPPHSKMGQQSISHPTLQNNLIARTNAHMPKIEVHNFGINQAKSVSPARTSQQTNPAFFSPHSRPSQQLLTVAASQKMEVVPIVPSLPAVPALRKSGVIEAPNSGLKVMPQELPVQGLVMGNSGIRTSGIVRNSTVQGQQQGIMTFTNIEQNRGVPPGIIPHPAAVNFARSLAQGTLVAPVTSTLGGIKPGAVVQHAQPETERALLGPPIHELIKNANVYQSVQPPLSSTNIQSKVGKQSTTTNTVNMPTQKEKQGRKCCCTVF